jgi:hypothetical protein
LIKIGEKEYEFNALGMIQAVARIRCIDMGGKLFEPKDAATNRAVFTQAGIELPNFPKLWIGVEDIHTEGSFYYPSDATSVTFPCEEPGSTPEPARGGCWRTLQPIEQLPNPIDGQDTNAIQDLNCVFGTAAVGGKWQTSNCVANREGQALQNGAAAAAGIEVDTYNFDAGSAKFGSICERDVPTTTAAPPTTAPPTGTSDSTCLKSGITLMIGMLFFCYQ